MTITKFQTARLVAGFAIAGLTALSAPAQADKDCYRGTLDKQYCDRDKDQVADLPLDESKWANPDTLIFAYTPVEDPAVYKKVWGDRTDESLACFLRISATIRPWLSMSH